VVVTHTIAYILVSSIYSNDGNICTTDTCNLDTNQCINTIQTNCCGNRMCETGESDTCSKDCGPFTLTASVCNGSCFVPRAVQFNINAISGIRVNSLFFSISAVEPVSTTITIETAAGRYQDSNEDDWITVAIGEYTITCKIFIAQ
jgi:hypothetical protein